MTSVTGRFSARGPMPQSNVPKDAQAIKKAFAAQISPNLLSADYSKLAPEFDQGPTKTIEGTKLIGGK